MANSDILVRWKADTSGYDSNMAKAKRTLDGFVNSNFTAGGAINQLSSSLTRMAANYVSVAAAIGGVTMAIRNNIETAKNFEKSMSGLSALTGKTGEDLNRLKEYAIELGSTTTLTASEVADAFRLIGSQQPQLLASSEAMKEVTKYAITLSEAAGIDLATASQTLSTSINQMGGDSENAARYVNVLAAAAQKGAGDIAWLGEAVVKSGTYAQAVGASYETLVANLETLAKAGYDAATSGTALRSIILALEKQSNNQLKPSVVGLTEAFANLGKQQLSIDGYAELVNQRFAAQAKTLAENASVTRDMTEAITGTNIAEEQAKVNTDNFAGAIRQLESAWEGFNLQLNDSNGMLTTFTKKVTQAIQSFSNYAFKNPTALWERDDNIENPNAAINQKPKKGGQTGAIKGSYVVVTDANGKTISAKHYDGLPPADDVNPPKPTKTKTGGTKKETWAPIDMASIAMPGISFGRSIADVQKDLAKSQKEYNEAGDDFGRASALAMIEKFQQEMEAMKSVGSPFADAYSHDFNKDMKRLSEDLPSRGVNKGDKEFEKTVGTISDMSGSLNQIAGGIQQLGIDLPEGLANTLTAIQGVSTILTGIAAVVSIIQTLTEISTTRSMIPLFSNGGIVHAAEGWSGVVPGSRFSGDQVPALLNSQELVLNTAQTGRLASALQGAQSGNGGTPYVEGECIILGANNTFKRKGQGEIVTTGFLKKMGII